MVRFKAMAAGLLVVGLGLVGCQSGGAGAQDRASADDLLVQGDRAFEAGAMGEALELYKLASVAARNERDSARFAEAAAQVSSSLSLLGRTTDGSPWLAQARQEKYGDDARSQARVLLRDRARTSANSARTARRPWSSGSSTSWEWANACSAMRCRRRPWRP
ncbi:MAG: hypothetical protein R3F17_16855 [Planctomycetota bacterium]